MKNKMNLLFFLCILFSAALLAAANSEQILTLEQCMDLAVQKNPELSIADKEWKKAKANIMEAYSTVLPSVDAHANFQKAWDLQKSIMPNFIKPMLEPLAPSIPELALMPDFLEISFGVENTFMYGATLTQPIFLGGAGIASIKMAYAAEKAAKLNYNSKLQNLIYSVSDAFYRSLLANELVQVQEEALNQAMTNLDIVKKRYNVGSASGFDKMRAEVEVANLKPEVISAKNNSQAALTVIRMLLGLKENTSIVIQGEMEFVYDDYGTLELSELQNRALQNRPEVNAL